MVVVAVVAIMGLGAASAFAAAPANDNFADREVLDGALPIELSRSNEEATKESGEELDLLAAAGHSVWFEWEATSSEWVTIGACEADFMQLAGIYTGSSSATLVKVPAVSGNTNQGPDCSPSQRQYSFKVVSGTKYEIAVDGNAFTPGGPTPDTEGSFTLRIKSTPAPPNDDFADAMPIDTRFEESYEGEDFYAAFARGYNWTATTEPGEPARAGDPSGASVWFSWTPPVTGLARLGGFSGVADLRLAMYAGSDLGSLQTIFSGTGFSAGAAEAQVFAGTRYWLAAYGPIGSGGEPAVASFEVQITMRVPTPPPPQPQLVPGPLPTPDTTPPVTTIGKRVIQAAKGMAEFRFASSEAASSFRCKLDARPFRACGSRRTYANLSPGKHVFRVVATDPAGNTDPTSAVARFKLPRQVSG